MYRITLQHIKQTKNTYVVDAPGDTIDDAVQYAFTAYDTHDPHFTDEDSNLYIHYIEEADVHA